jgi:hypothetical protein
LQQTLVEHVPLRFDEDAVPSETGNEWVKRITIPRIVGADLDEVQIAHSRGEALNEVPE